MSTTRTAIGALLAALLVGGYVAAHPFVSDQSTPLPVESDWKARADAWFTATDDAGRRKEMRQITRALRQPCRYCHTPDFTGYTDKRLISQQMMALSAEHGVACADCHGGKNTLTDMGRTAQAMWALSHEQKAGCETCHVKQSRFAELTPEGKTFAETGWKAWKAKWDARPAAAQDPAAPSTPAPSSPAPTPQK